MGPAYPGVGDPAAFPSLVEILGEKEVVEAGGDRMESEERRTADVTDRQQQHRCEEDPQLRLMPSRHPPQALRVHPRTSCWCSTLSSWMLSGFGKKRGLALRVLLSEALLRPSIALVVVLLFTQARLLPAHRFREMPLASKLVRAEAVVCPLMLPTLLCLGREWAPLSFLCSFAIFKFLAFLGSGRVTAAGVSKSKCFSPRRRGRSPGTK